MNDKLQKLQKYADQLKRRLDSPVPEKHKNNRSGFKQMLEIDLKKTQMDINKLKGL